MDWQVGDTRNVSLSSFQYYEYTSQINTQPAQTAQLVILHKGSYYGEDYPENLHYVVGFKNCVCYSCFNQESYPFYDDSLMLTVEDNIYNALPSNIKSCFKEFYTTYTINYNYVDYLSRHLATPAEIEILGTGKYSVSVEWSKLFQFSYYINSNNRKKTLDSSACPWWTRSRNSTYATLCTIDKDGNSTQTGAYPYNKQGVSLFGCI